MKQKVLILAGCLLAISLFSVHGYADGGEGDYKVTITNITSGQTFTPSIVLNHKTVSASLPRVLLQAIHCRYWQSQEIPVHYP